MFFFLGGGVEFFDIVSNLFRMLRKSQARDRLADGRDRIYDVDLLAFSSYARRGHNNSRTHSPIRMNFRQILAASHKCNNILISFCPCARYPLSFQSIELSSLLLACAVVGEALASPEVRRLKRRNL
jgi:hypothetical protein